MRTVQAKTSKIVVNKWLTALNFFDRAEGVGEGGCALLDTARTIVGTQKANWLARPPALPYTPAPRETCHRGKRAKETFT